MILYVIYYKFFKNFILTPYFNLINLNAHPETLAETIESVPLCITDLFQNKSVAYL